jgi:hypothetical protein
MAIGIREYPIPPVGGVNRSPVATLQIPAGAVVLSVFKPEGDSARVIVRGDNAQALVDRSFVAVKQNVALNAAEIAGAYVGSFTGYRTADELEVYHLIAL